MEGNSISDAIGSAIGDFSGELWLVAGIGLTLFAVIWGVPKGVQFLKKFTS